MSKRIEDGELRWDVDMDGDSAQLQVDGHDIVSISDVRTDGKAHIIVWATSHPDSTIVWEGYVNVRERQGEEDSDA
jgi:hypothetical protein